MTAKAKEPGSYAEGVNQARQLVAAGRLNDPGEHFPYKLDHMLRLVDDNTPMGPSGPDDDRVAVEDVMTVRIAHATGDYIAAQAAYLADPSARNKAVYDGAAEDLVAARKSHRRSRVDADGNPCGAILANQAGVAPAHLVGPRHRRAGEE